MRYERTTMVVLSNALPTPALSGSGRGTEGGATPIISAGVASSAPVYSVYDAVWYSVVLFVQSVKRKPG